MSHEDEVIVCTTVGVGLYLLFRAGIVSLVPLGIAAVYPNSVYYAIPFLPLFFLTAIRRELKGLGVFMWAMVVAGFVAAASHENTIENALPVVAMCAILIVVLLGERAAKDTIGPTT